MTRGPSLSKPDTALARVGVLLEVGPTKDSILTSPDLKIYRDLADKIEQEVADLAIIDSESLGSAISRLGKVVDAGKKATALRTSLSKPYRDAVKTIDVTINEVMAPVIRATTVLRNKIASYQATERVRAIKAEETRRREILAAQSNTPPITQVIPASKEACGESFLDEVGEPKDLPEFYERLDAAAREGRIPAVTETIQGPVHSVPWTEPASTSKTVVAPDGTRSTLRESWTYKVLDLNEVPVAFLIRTVNDKDIKTAIAAGVREIAGLEIFPESTVAVSGPKEQS